MRPDKEDIERDILVYLGQHSLLLFLRLPADKEDLSFKYSRGVWDPCFHYPSWLEARME